MLESSAIGITSELGEEEISHFLVVKEKFSDVAPFLKWLHSRLQYHVVPSKLNFVESLPKTANFNIQKNRLPESKIPIIYSVDVAKTGFKATKSLGR